MNALRRRACGWRQCAMVCAMGWAMAFAPAAQANPVIDSVFPEPLPLGEMAQVLGSGFGSGQLLLTVAGVSQNIVLQEDAELLFMVSPLTPLGPAELRVTVDDEAEVSIEVVVAPAPPAILSVSPDPIVLGEVVTVNGSNLDQVTAVTLGGIQCEMMTATASIVVFLAPISGDLPGTQELRVEAPSGFDVTSISVLAPAPVVDQLVPNPVRQGDILTIKGTIIGNNPLVDVGGAAAELVSASASEVRVQVPETMDVGGHDMTITVGTVTSEPVGPLFVEIADADRPLVHGVYPSTVGPEAPFWIVGEHLSGLHGISGGFSVESCDGKSCRVVGGGDESGLLKLVVSSDAGMDLCVVHVDPDKDVEVPHVTSVSPQPAFRGESITLAGDNLFSTQSVVVGGVSQEISFVGVDEVVVALSLETPMGQERLFVSGLAGSEPLMINVLERWDAVEPDATSTDAGAADVGPGPANPSVDAQDDLGSSRDQGDGASAGQGCASGDSKPWLPVVSLCLVLLWMFRRQRSPDAPRGPGAL